jgi:hypothetical protein
MQAEDVKLVSSEGVEKDISSSSLSKSKYLNDRFSKGEKIIKLEVNEPTLVAVVEYLTHYTSEEPIPIPAVLKTNDLKTELKSKWDVDFIEAFTFEQTFHLINAGALLELEHLHDLACARIASFMKDKAPEEVNKEFTIECQLTADEAKSLGLDVGDGADA